MRRIKELTTRDDRGVRLAAFVIMLMAAVPVLSASDHGRHALAQGAVWVVNRDAGDLTVFDARTGAVLTTVSIGPGTAPHDVCISERSKKAYVTAEGVDQVAIFDLRTLKKQVISVGPLPHHCEVSHDGETLYVSLASHTPAVGAPRVAVIDIESNAVSYLTSSNDAAARSHGLFASREGDKLFVAHDTGNALSVVDLETGLVDFTIPGILRAEEPVPTRFGNSVWVSARGENSVTLIDLDTQTIAATIPIQGVQPESVMLTPSERTLAVTLRGSPAALAFVDAVNQESLGSVVFPLDGLTFGDLGVMTRDGRYVYATYDRGIAGGGGVAIIDVRRREFVDSFDYPTVGRPHGIAITNRRPQK
jgi:DNA-binding beta-propeller fold protein YncE